MKETSQPGIAEVAAAAAVSVATVSRVLNGKEGVAEEVRRRVLEAVERLGYRPLRRVKRSAHLAEGAAGVTRPVAYLSRGPNPRGLTPWAQAFAAASRRFQAAGYMLALQPVDDLVEPEARRAGKPLPKGLLERYAGLLAVDRESGPWLNAAALAGLPAARLGYYPIAAPLPQIVGDSFLGVLRLMEHLLKRGHRRIALWRVHLGENPKGAERALNEREKYAAYRFALDEAGIEFRSEWEVDMPFDWKQLEPHAKRLLAVRPAPTALLIDNDWITSVIVRMPAGKETLPPAWHRQFELAHFIDTGESPAHYGLTCAALPVDRMSDLAAEFILEQIRGHRYPPDFLVRVPPYFLPAEKVTEPPVLGP